jgi:hypothetical protein
LWAASYQGSNTFNHTTDTHGPFSVGASQPGNKLIIVAGQVGDAFGDTANVTCNGVSMNLVGSLSSGGTQNIVNIWYLQVAGSVVSATFTVTGHSAGTLSDSELGIYWASGVNPVPASHVEHGYQLFFSPNSLDNVFTVPASGFAIIALFDAQYSEATTFSGTAVTTDGTADSGATNNNGITKFANLQVAGSATVHAVGSSGGYNLASAVAVWGP